MPVVGDGMIANVFKREFTDSEFLIFASGVSDSSEKDNTRFDREKSLIIETIGRFFNLTFVYFSSALCESIDNEYYRHKIEMENIIKKNSKKYLIFRLPQIIGKNGNQNNLFNFIKNKIIKGHSFTVKENTLRSFLDVEDLPKIFVHSNNIVNDTVNIAYIEKTTVYELVEKISTILQKKAIFEIVDGEFSSLKNSQIVDNYINLHKIENYTEKIIRKYL